VGKIRLLVGSLGVSSGNDCDPSAAWFGLSLTALIDLAIPTFALLLATGVQTNVLFDKMFKDVNLLLPIASNVYASVKDLCHPLGRRGGTPELYTMNNIGYRPIPGGDPTYWPNAGYMTAPDGYSGAPILLYVRTAPGAGTGAPRFLYLDPSGDKNTGYHLRQVTPVTDPTVPMGDPTRLFNLATGTSWGRFAMLPTSMALHSNGYVVAVNPSCDHMLILALPATSAPDADAPWASAPLEPGTAPGRLLSPALVAIRPDQTILVLEAGNQRIQAFSRGGHPVPAFPPIEKPVYWFPLISHAPPDDVVYPP
jgi:hypothetical protein